MPNFYKTHLYQNLSCFSTTLKTISRNIQQKKLESEVAILDKFIFEGSRCIDIGGAYGRYTLPMSKLSGKTGHVYSFEPGRYSFAVLSTIIKFYHLKNVTIVKKALSDREGTTKLISPVKNTGRIGYSLSYISTKEASNSLTEQIEMTTLDKYCSDNNIPKVDFIKCDIEGSELLAFHGGEKTIQRYKPVVLSEIDVGNLKRHNCAPNDIYYFFSELGYTCFTFQEDRLIKVTSLSKDSNYFFIPIDRTL